MKNYYLLEPMVKANMFYSDFDDFFELYFYSSLRSSSLPSDMEFVRAEVFSERKYINFITDRKNGDLRFNKNNDIRDVMDSFVAAVENEDFSSEACMTVMFLVKLGNQYFVVNENLDPINDHVMIFNSRLSNDTSSRFWITNGSLETLQRAVADFDGNLNYIDKIDYGGILRTPKRLLDIFVMMIETISKVQNIPQKIRSELDFSLGVSILLGLRDKSTSEILSTDIYDLVQKRIKYACLSRAAIQTVGQLLMSSDDELMNIKALNLQAVKTAKRWIMWRIENPPN